MSSSRSRASTQTASTTNNESRNLNLQDTEGVTVGEAGGDVTIISTDHNAFDRASDLARLSVDTAESLGRSGLELSLQTTRSVTDFAESALAEQGDVLNQAFTFGDRAFGTVEKALAGVSGAYQDSAAYNAKALQAVSAAGADATARVQATSENAVQAVGTLFRDAFEGVTDFIGNLQGKAQTQLGETVTALNAIAVEQNKSSDQRIAEISENAIKYTLIAVGVLTGGAVLFAIFKK